MFEITIDGADGSQLTRVDNFWDAEVVVPLNDLRQAKFSLSLFDPAVTQIGDGRDRTVRIRYKRGSRKRLIMRGIVEDPEYDADAGVCTVTVQDPIIKLQNAYHRYGDAVVASPDYTGSGQETDPVLGDGHSYTWDGDGLWLLITSALNQTYPGFIQGVNLVTASSFVRRAERGSNVWETVQEMMTSTSGFDVEFMPVDQWDDPNGFYASLPDKTGYYVQVNCYDDQGTDRSGDVVFDKGFGRENASNIVYQPKSSQLWNDCIVTPPAGERGFDEPGLRGRARNGTSQGRYSAWQRWETAQENDSPAQLVEKARGFVAIFGAGPPKGFTVTPNLERSGPDTFADPPLYPFDFGVGDTIKARVRAGYLRQDNLLGRVLSATLTQADQNSTVQQTLECVPPNTDLADIV